MSQKIIIKIAVDGATEVQTEGFAGSRCQQASEFIETALGTRTSERLTPEFYQSQSNQQFQNQQTQPQGEQP